MAFDLPCQWENNPKYAGTSLAKEIRVMQNVTGLRNFTVNDVIGYTQQLYENGIPSSLNRIQFHESFEWLQQQTNANYIELSGNDVEFLDLLFEVLDKDEDSLITPFEFAIGVAVMCGGDVKYNFRCAFDLLTPSGGKNRQQRNLNIKDVHDAYCTIFRLLYQLHDEILDRVGCDPDYYARTLTLRAFHRHNKHHRKHGRRELSKKHHRKYSKDKKKFRSYINVATFTHWYHIGVEHIICDVPMLVEDHYNGGGLHIQSDSKGLNDDYDVGHHHSMISMTDAIRILGLNKFTPGMIIQYVTDLCNEDGTISEVTLHQGITKLIRKHYMSLPLMERPLADHILQRLFIVFQIENTGYVTFTDIASALLVFCGGSMDRKAKCAFSLFSQKVSSPQKAKKGNNLVDIGISHEGICNVLTAIFKIVSDLDPGHHFNSAASCSDIASELSSDIFAQFPKYANHSTGVSLLPVDIFASIFTKILNKFDASLVDMPVSGRQSEGADSENESIQSNSSEEYMRKLTRQRSRDSMEGDSLYSGGTPTPYGSECELNSECDTSENASGAIASAGEIDSYDPDSDSERDFEQSHSGPSVHQHYEHVFANEAGSVPNAELDDTSLVVAELRSARRILNLNGFSAHDVLDILSEFSSSVTSNGVISMSSWLTILSYLSKLNNCSNDEFMATTQLGSNLFNCFDTSGNKAISYAHFAVGLSLALCEHDTDPYEEKLLMAVSLLDTNNDDKVTLTQLHQLVFCVLSVVRVCSSTASSKMTRLDVSVERLSIELVNTVCRTHDIDVVSSSTVSYTQMVEFVKACVSTFSL